MICATCLTQSLAENTRDAQEHGWLQLRDGSWHCPSCFLRHPDAWIAHCMNCERTQMVPDGAIGDFLGTCGWSDDEHGFCCPFCQRHTDECACSACVVVRLGRAFTFWDGTLYRLRVSLDTMDTATPGPRYVVQLAKSSGEKAYLGHNGLVLREEQAASLPNEMVIKAVSEFLDDWQRACFAAPWPALSLCIIPESQRKKP